MSTIFLSGYKNCGWPPARSLASITSVVRPRWAVVRLAANPADGSYLVYVEMIAITEQDFDVAAAVLGSFLVG